MISNLPSLFTRPLTNKELFLILLSLVSLLCFLCFLEQQLSKRKTRAFPQKYPGAAIILLFASDCAIKRAEINSTKGTRSNLLAINKTPQGEKKKGYLFYAQPGDVSVNVRIVCQETGKRSYTGHFSFRAEQNGIYQIMFDTKSGTSKMTLLRGETLSFEIPEEKEKKISSWPETIWTNEKKTSIAGMFYQKEGKRILKLCLLMTVCMCYLVFYGDLSPYFFLLPVLLFFQAALLIPIKGIRKFDAVFHRLSPYDQEQVEAEFQSPHPYCKLYMGEVHLLSNWLLCRHGGRLSLIPIDQIQYLKTANYSKTYGLAKSLIIGTNQNERYQLEFFAGHQKDLPSVVSYIQSKNEAVLIQSESR